MNLLFLDVDGVLNSRTFFARRAFVRDVPFAHFRNNIDRDAVARVQKICDASDAHVVISSAWRTFYKLDDLKDRLRDFGLTATVHGATPEFEGKPRGLEIAAYLDACAPARVTSFVILDDEDGMAHLAHRLVRTNFKDGLTDRHVWRAIELFKFAS